MSIIRENNKNRGRVFRCFAIYNTDRCEFTHVQKRKCGKSYETTIESVRELAEKQSASGLATLSLKNSYSEWYGQMDDKKKCYFLLMLYPKASLQVVQSSLNQLIRLITNIPNYQLLTIEQLDQLKRSDIRKLIDKLENEYIEQERDGIGQPSDDEQVGSRIIVQTQRTNQQSSFRSQHLQQQSKIETKTENAKTLDKENIQFGVYRGFLVYNPKDKKQLFSLRRGSKQAFQQSVPLITKHVDSLQNEGSFVKLFNAKSEWHAAVDKGCYFLLMTYQNAEQNLCDKVLEDLIKKFSKHNYENMSPEQLNDSLLWEVSHQLKSAEKHYEYDCGALGSPSDNEQIPKLCEVKQSALGTTKNYSSFSATKQELIHLEIIPRSQLLLLGQKEIESPIQDVKTILEKLNRFEPQINDTENLLQYSVMGSLIILLIIFVFLFHQ